MVIILWNRDAWDPQRNGTNGFNSWECMLSCPADLQTDKGFKSARTIGVAISSSGIMEMSEEV